ncbi:MAG TPA: family 10 glycosylhydrolase [Pirellulaceae bacterium]|jgi:hypothetical protein
MFVIALAATAISHKSAVAAEPIDVRIRIAWGGGEARSWQGTIQLSEGTLSEVQPLGLEVDEPGSMLLIDDKTLHVFPRTPRSYDGLDLRVQAPQEAKLLLQLDADATARQPPIEFPLLRVIKELARHDLDDRNNRLLAQRSPGDALRVSFARPTLIFTTGEKFELDVQPQRVELTANATYVVSATLGPARTDENTWSEEKELRADGNGAAKPLALVVPLPEQEGVYDLRLALHAKRLTPNLLRGKPIASRKIQLVVTAPVKTAQPPPAAWQNVLEFDPASPKWWEQVARLPAWTRLPMTPRPIENRPAGIRAHQGRNWVELAPRAWQAYPLSTPGIAGPHMIEIEYPSDLEQTLAISIVEPNAEGRVGPIGLDSGIDVSPPAAGHQPGVRRHELIVYPQTKTPYLLLVNRRDDATAVLGKITIKTGPNSLPPLLIPSMPFATRQLAAYYDKPLIAENFSAPEALDPTTHRSFDDWVTFGAASERLLETLQHGGYNAVMLTAACDGSAIYPSELLQPSPKYDSGIFFESGQDAVRKDVLELLFRLCDRNGIVLIPGVQFAGPLPELETVRQTAAASEVTGLEPIGPDGRSWIGRGGGRGGAGVYYNPLDERVQRAMVAVVGELAERYGHHASFGGVAVHLNAETYALLPDETCSLDEVTFTRFLAETNKHLPPPGPNAIAARWDFVRREAAQPWLDWRAEKMTTLYRQMRNAIVHKREGAKLYLTTANLLGTKQLQSVLKPELPTRDSAVELLPLLGLYLNRLTDADIVVPRPQRITTMISPTDHDQDRHWNRTSALDRLFLPAAHRTSLDYLVPAPLALADFDAASPFGPDKTRTLLISHVLPADAAYRERFVESIARLDTATMIDGSWMMPIGQQAALAPFVKTYRRLPAEPFEGISASGQPLERSVAPQDLVVRTLNKQEKTYFYVVNPTPWPVTASIQFSAPGPLRIMPYCEDRQSKTKPSGSELEWTVSLEPFDLIGGELASGQAKVTKWNVTRPPEAATTIGDQSREISRRANFLRQNPRLVTLFNPSFEIKAADGSPAGWQYARAQGIDVKVETRTASGAADSLHLEKRAANVPLWVRSSPIHVPTTGRIQMTARIRLPEGAPQPQLRLAVEGKLDGQVYYRRANVGLADAGGPAATPLVAGQWSTQSITLTDLPTAGLTDLCVGFDLMSDGKVWIDDVQVQDLWLDDATEYKELIKSATTAELQAQAGRLNEARMFVEDYWPSFLRRNVQLPEGKEALPSSAGAKNSRKPRGIGLPNLIPEKERPAQSAERTTERNRWWPTWPWK